MMRQIDIMLKIIERQEREDRIKKYIDEELQHPNDLCDFCKEDKQYNLIIKDDSEDDSEELQFYGRFIEIKDEE